MKFGYVQLSVEATPACPNGVTYRPYIPLEVHGPTGKAVVIALVDTGADETILPAFLLREIGAKYEGGAQAQFRGVGGHLVTVNYSQVDLAIDHGEGFYRWPAKVGFLDGKHVAVLGFKGFLEYFNATFDSGKHYLRLKANAQFQGEK